MRCLVGSKQGVHIWNVTDYVKQAQANLQKQDSSRFITMQNLFRKLYLSHLNQHEQIKRHQRALNNHLLLGQAPARTIADYFHQKSKTYSEDFLTATINTIAQSYVISKSDNSGTLDSLGYKLFLSSQFNNLSEQLKYALRNNKLGFNNLITVMESLLKMEYVDYEVINLLLLYTQRQIEGGDPYLPLKDWKGDRQFQIQKESYYNPAQEDIRRMLSQSQEVTTALSFVKHIHSQWLKEQRQTVSLKNQGVQQINQLVNEISLTNKNFRKLVEGILTIRKEYRKMVKFSQDEQILRNPSLNLELLELQQKLLGVKLLNIDDIKNSRMMDTSDYEVKRVEKIILSILDIKKLDPILAFIDKTSIQVVNRESPFAPDEKKVSLLVNILAKFANIDRFVYHTADGRSLISLKWQKTLIEQNPAMNITNNPLYQELNVSRIFRRIYSDVLNFFNQKETQIKQIFQKSSLENKINFLDAYCRVGLNEKALLSATTFQKNKYNNEIPKLNVQQLSVLVHLFNDIGIFISNYVLKHNIFIKLQEIAKLQINNRINLSMRNTIDTLNYLIQNHRNQVEYERLYSKYLNILERKAVYSANSEHQNQTIVEAFKILASDLPNKYCSHPVYLNYLHNLVTNNYKKNPYHSILKETIYKWANKETALTSMQPYLNMGFNNKYKNGVLFSNSDQTSLEGELRSGDLNSYIIRLQIKNSLKINQFSVSSFIHFDLLNKQGNFFKLKSVQLLQKKFNEALERQKNKDGIFYDELKTTVSQFLQVYPPSLVTKRIEFKMRIIDKARNSHPSVETQEQYISQKTEFLLQILQLHKLLLLLDQDFITDVVPYDDRVDIALNQKLQKQEQREIKIQFKILDVDHVKSMIINIKKLVQQLMQVVGQNLSNDPVFIKANNGNKIQNKIQLNGQRQSLQSFDKKPNDHSPINIFNEVVNMKYYNDYTFCQYEDWKKQINQFYRMGEIKYQNLSNLGKILASKLCDRKHTDINKITYYPILKKQQKLSRTSLEFKLLKPSVEKEEQINRPSGYEEHLGNQTDPQLIKMYENDMKQQRQQHLNRIIDLQYMKRHIKKNHSPDMIAGLFLDFQFSQKQEDVRYNDSEFKLMKRNPQSYFNFLQDSSERKYLESPYVRYILAKLSKTDKVRILLDKRKQSRVQQRILYQKGAINADAYYASISKIEDDIIAALQDLKSKLLDSTENKILNGELKMIALRKQQIQIFQNIIKSNFSYNRCFDEDFIVADGDYEIAMQYKFGRIYSNYNKIKLMNKIANNIKLGTFEENELNKWHLQILQSIFVFKVKDDYTNKDILVDMSNYQLFLMQEFGYTPDIDIPMQDLLIELSCFIDTDLITAYEREVKAEYFNRLYKIPKCLFEKSVNTHLQKLQNQIEASILNNKSKLSDQELNTIQEMFKVYKTEGLKERKRYQQLCSSFHNNIVNFNKQDLRNQLIEEYVRVLQGQFFKEYDPKLISNIKQQETNKLWNQIVGLQYGKCSQEKLHGIIKLILLRLDIIGKNTPPFFGNFLLKLLLHPKVKDIYKETLLASIQMNSIDLKLDSADILMIASLPSKSKRDDISIKRQFKTASNNKIVKILKLRMQPSITNALSTFMTLPVSERQGAKIQKKKKETKPKDTIYKEKNIYVGKSKEVKQNQAKSNQAKLKETKSNQIKLKETKQKETKSNESRSKSKDRKLNETKSNQDKSKTKKPNEAKPKEIISNETKSKEVKLKEAKQNEAKSKERKSNERKSNEAKSKYKKPFEAKSKDAKQNVAKSKDAKQNVAKSNDAKQNVAKSNDAKQNVAKSNDAKQNVAKSNDAKQNAAKAKQNEAKSKDAKHNEAKSKEKTRNVAKSIQKSKGKK